MSLQVNANGYVTFGEKVILDPSVFKSVGVNMLAPTDGTGLNMRWQSDAQGKYNGGLHFLF